MPFLTIGLFTAASSLSLATPDPWYELVSNGVADEQTVAHFLDISNAITSLSDQQLHVCEYVATRLISYHGHIEGSPPTSAEYNAMRPQIGARAVSCANELKHRHPDSADSYKILLDALDAWGSATKNKQESRERRKPVLAEAYEKFPKDVQILQYYDFLMGQNLTIEQRKDLAKKTMEASPDSVLSHLHYAAKLREIGLPDESKQEMRKVFAKWIRSCPDVDAPGSERYAVEIGQVIASDEDAGDMVEANRLRQLIPQCKWKVAGDNYDANPIRRMQEHWVRLPPPFPPTDKRFILEVYPPALRDQLSSKK